MHKNRNDCAKHNIIKYDIKKKQIQIIYANMDIQVHVTGIS